MAVVLTAGMAACKDDAGRGHKALRVIKETRVRPV